MHFKVLFCERVHRFQWMAEGIHVLNKLENLLDTKTIGVNRWPK